MKAWSVRNSSRSIWEQRECAPCSQRHCVWGRARCLEAVESGSTELAALRLWHLVLSGAVALSDAERDEVSRLTAGGGPAERLGVSAGGADLQPVVVA